MRQRSAIVGTTTITAKGQLTIPAGIRSKLGIRRGTTIVLSIVGEELHGMVCRSDEYTNSSNTDRTQAPAGEQ